MLYGFMNSPLNPILAEIDLAAGLGADYLELTMDAPMAHFTQIRDQECAIRQALDQRGLGLICHMPTFVNPADLTPRIREAALMETLDSLDAAAALGATRCVLHPGMIRGLGVFVKDMTLNLAMNALAAIAQQAETLGIGICLENMPPNCNAFIEPEEMQAALSRFPGLSMILDVGHANIADKTGDRNHRMIAAFSPRIRHLHLSDNKGQKDDHIPIGTGTVDYPSIIADLKRIGYDGTATLEIFTQDRSDWRKSRDRFAEMWGL